MSMKSLYQRLKQIVYKRFKCELELHILNNNVHENIDKLNSQHAAFYRNRKTRFFIRGANVFVPIHETRNELVLVEAKGALGLNATDLDQLIDTIHLVLKDLMNLQSDLEITRQRQAYLESDLNDNVIPIFRHMFN